MRSRSEQGSVGGIEGVLFGVLIFVLGILVVVNAWGVVDAKMATSAAAREAARAYVEGTTESAAFTNARTAADGAMAGHNRALTNLAITGDVGDHYRRCEPIIATVATKVSRIPIGLLGHAAGTYMVSASHAEVVDPYKAGLEGTASCGN